MAKCEYCGRMIKGELVKKVLRGKRHVFCTEHCFRLYFYKIPKFDLEMMYSLFTASVSVPDFQTLIEEEAQK